MASAYRVAPLFLIRLAGVPFNALAGLQTSAANEEARRFLDGEEQFPAVKKAALEFVTRRENGLSPEEFRTWKSVLQRNEVPAPGLTPTGLENYVARARRRCDDEKAIASALEPAMKNAREELQRRAQKFLPDYLVFASAETKRLLEASDFSPNRNSRTRERERHLLLYLQRVASKNDTFSRFGPSSWGRADEITRGVKFAPPDGVTRRDIFLERWTAHALAAAINHDPETLAETCPRLHPNGVLMGSKFVSTETGEAFEVADPALLARCDGKTPMHALGGSPEMWRELIERKVVVAGVEVAALEPHAFDVLRDDVQKWRPQGARERWLPRVESLAQLPAALEATDLPTPRREILSAARFGLSQLGAERKAGERSLYSATNPIAEECFRETNFVINEKLLNAVTDDAAPWIDFWRDTYAFVASRVAGVLCQVFRKVPQRAGAVPLPAFLRACEMGKIPLTSIGLVGPAHMAFQEVKAAFRARLQAKSDLEEYELTTEDCHLVRLQFEYQKFDEFTYPSLDLQLAASSLEAIARGEYRWILSEVHPPPALLHHCMFWSCPDQEQLGRALASIGGRNFHFGFFAADFTAHTTVRAFDALPDLTTFVAPQRAHPNWKQFPPSHTEVYETEGDIRLRHAMTKEDLGSFARNWIIPLGFHPFQFGLAPQMPRLRCGRVIVQRRSWTVAAAELGAGNFTGVSRELVVAVERLRATKNWPRYVYIRPSEPSLRRSGAEGRDKDTKPVFIDLESYLFLEIFHRWLTKAGELEVTEMLPAPDDLWWREGDGAYTCELRTLVLPK